MKTLPATAGQAVYQDFINSPDTCVPAKRLHAAYLVDATLELGRLELAVRQVVAAHDSLRTAVESADGGFVQVVRQLEEIADPVLEKIDWDGTDQALATAVAALDDWWTTPRPLASRILAGHGPDGQTLVVCAFNHACSDGISAELVFDQIRKAYEDPKTGPDREGAMQFAEYYGAWAAEGAIEACDDWLERFELAAPAVPPWMVQSKLASPRVGIGLRPWTFAPGTTERLRALGRTHLATDFEVMAACAGLYFRRADGAPAALGVIHSGRDRARGFEVAGLLRSYVVDAVDHTGLDSAAEAIGTRRDELRALMSQHTKLPGEEACRVAGRPAGWRAGELGPWEVELNGMFDAPELPRFDGAAVRSARVPLPDEAECENGGPTFVLSFGFGAEQVRAVLRYVSPPVDQALARRVAEDLESLVHLLHDRPATPVDELPALHRIAGGHP